MVTVVYGVLVVRAEGDVAVDQNWPGHNAHTHCSISQPFSAYDVFSPPPAVVTPPLTYDHVTEAAASEGHPAATGVVTCHHHRTNTHAVGGGGKPRECEQRGPRG